MKQFFLAALIGLSVYGYMNRPAASTTKTASNPSNVARPVEPHVFVIAAAPSYSSRWRTGVNAQTDLQTGLNAQTSFEPFAPSEHAAWNQTPGYTIIGGAQLRGIRSASR